MKDFLFQGIGYNTLEESLTNENYSNWVNGEPIQFKLSTPEGAGIIVTGCYKGAGWMIGVETLDEDKSIDWEIAINPSHGGYRNQLSVTAPDDVKLTCLNKVETLNI